MSRTRAARLNRKMDRLKMLEKEGLLKSREGSRAVGKFLQNKLAVVGLIVFALILLSSIFAPLITKYDPAMIDLRSRLSPLPGTPLWHG